MEKTLMKAALDLLHEKRYSNLATDEDIKKYICKVCTKKCTYNKFCTFMFNQWCIDRVDTIGFVDIITAFITYEGITDPYVSNDFRTYICDTCFICKTPRERRANAACNLAWFSQTFEKDGISNTQRTETKYDNKPKLFSTESILQWF